MVRRVLRSKTTAPIAHHDALLRARVVDRLLATRAPLWLLVAPAGFGKTTVLAQVVDRTPAAVAWVSVDRADNDPVRFWSHVGASVVAAVEGEIGSTGGSGRLDQLLSAFSPNDLDRGIDEILAAIEARTDDVLLVLDDLHEVDDPVVMDGIGRIVSNPPPNLTVVVSSRSDPALPIGRLRASGQVEEIRFDDLVFSAEEVARVLSVDEELVADIVEHTGGWPTAVRMLAVGGSAHRGHDGLVELVAEHRSDLADVLAAEVLAAQPDDVQRFLVESSIVDELDPGLCDLLTGRAGSLSILRRLARDQIFTTPIDSEHTVFRYHQLFRSFLQGQALELGPDRRRVLHSRAADWYASAGRVSRAIDHAIAADRHDDALVLMKANYLEYSQAGLLTTIGGWLEAYGHERAAEDGEMLAACGWIDLNAQRFDRIDRWCGASFADPEEHRLYRAEVHAILSHRARHLGDLTTARQEARAAVSMVGEGSSLRGSVANAALGLADALAGQASAALEAAIVSGREWSVDSSVVAGYSGLAYVASSEPDRLEEAEAFADEALSFVTSPTLERFHQPALALAVKARVERTRGRLADAEELASRAARVAADASEPLVGIVATCEQAHLAHLRGDQKEARRLLRTAETAVGEQSGDHLADVVRATRNAVRFVTVDGQRLLPGAVELSERELAVVRMLPHRLPRKELAAQLHISENTVKSHLTSIRHKLGLVGREDIVARARDLGLIGP